jgi:hypothetical protein
MPPFGDLFVFAELDFLARSVIDKPVLTLTARLDRRIQRAVARGQAPIHRDDLFGRHPEPTGDPRHLL